ncbi:MAG: hypothetical protein AAB800_05370, partial [Patescibacteria group bacterium]
GRNISRSDSGLLWAGWQDAGVTNTVETDYLMDPNGKTWTADIVYAPLTEHVPYQLDIRLVRLGSLLFHEDYSMGNFKKVRTTPHWDDRPLFVGERNGSLVLLDGATRTGWIIMRLGTKAEDQIVPIQVVDPSYLSLDTWLSPDQRLTIDEVWQYVAQGIKVLPRQTRFGVEIDGVNYSVAQTQPLVKFEESILDFLEE